MGIVKPIQASWLSIWVTFRSGKQPPAKELFLNIPLRTCLFLVTLQYPLLELCVPGIWALGSGVVLTAPARAEPARGARWPCSGGRYFTAVLCHSVSFQGWPCCSDLDNACHMNYWSSIFWMQCPVEHCACCASHFHQSNASIWGKSLII